jgi:hypothetical protein
LPTGESTPTKSTPRSRWARSRAPSRAVTPINASSRSRRWHRCEIAARSARCSAACAIHSGTSDTPPLKDSPSSVRSQTGRRNRCAQPSATPSPRCAPRQRERSESLASQGSLRPLVSAMDDRFRCVRLAATWALEDLGCAGIFHARAADRLERLLDGEDDPYIAYATYWALGALRGSDARHLLFAGRTEARPYGKRSPEPDASAFGGKPPA